ncbi:putative spermidine/putrescine transport system ATP-binding protein/spermidine/putrescine transport system ATP-binding protein [Rhizobiales bacterium GAS113]|nr:putative spermidine/putrescine transport system ATP-binding protein/spermidine/putrescine transport system ATP-binding protein [Rhizobiales bacterium GAS113]
MGTDAAMQARSHAAPPESDRTLTLDGISKTFGDVVALRQTSLSIASGELVALLGPSGCGKTTTLRIVAGFETSDTGRVLIGQQDVTRLPPDRRELGMVFQNYGLFPHLKVGENVAFGLKMRRVGRSEIARRVTEMLNTVRLPGYEDRYVSQLSGGQQQRVALARSLVTNPRIFLLDEPLGALDKNLREGMQFELRQLQRRLGITTILVTHDQEEALTMSDRVVVMNTGRILQIGTPEEIYERPRTRFVAEFLGTANILDAALEANDARGGRIAILREGAPAIGIAYDTDRLPRTGARLQLAQRPEKLLLAPPGASGEGIVDGTVREHVFRGQYHAYQLAVPGINRPLFAYTSPAVAGQVYAPGDEVSVRFDAHNLVVLADEVAS